MWNVRGLNGRARRSVVREFVVQEQVSVVCLQETKVVDLSVTFCNELTGTGFDCGFLPSVGASGGEPNEWVAAGMSALSPLVDQGAR